MKPIVLYLRVSTMEQSVESQKDDLLVWSKLNGFDVKKIFGETVSGYDTTVEREEYDNMKSYVLKHKIYDIGVWEISRLSRSMSKLVTELDYFTKHKINVHFRKENLSSLSDNATNKLILQIMGAMAELERNTFIERGARGRITAVQKGRMIGYSIPPYGYMSDKNGLLAVNPEEAKVIQMIYELASKGHSLYRITEILNSKGIPTRYNKLGKQRTFANGTKKNYIWRANVVKQILNRTLNKGIRHYKNLTINTPAIVSEALWEKANQSLKDKPGYILRTKYNYLFKGKMKCGGCGRNLNTFKAKDVEYGYYMCSARGDKLVNCPNNKYVNSKMIDDDIYKAIFQHKYLKPFISKDAKDDISKDEKQKEIEYYTDQINDLLSKRKRLKKLYLDNYIDYDEYEKENIIINNQENEFKNKLMTIQNDLIALSQIDINQIIKKYKNSTDFNLKREFVEKYVNKIIARPIARTNIAFAKPLQKNEKVIYAEIFAFNYNVPIKALLTPYTRNLYISATLQYLNDFDLIVDTK